jgi:putative transposase
LAKTHPDYRRTRRTVSLHDAHLVFVTKDRRRILNKPMPTDRESTLREVCDTLKAELVKLNSEPDHLHLLAQYPPTLSTNELIRRLKSATAPKMHAEYTRRCNPTRIHPHYWTPSSFTVPASRAPLSIIKQHIENQARPPGSAPRTGPANPGPKSRALRRTKDLRST